jgi:hypothetical protein
VVHPGTLVVTFNRVNEPPLVATAALNASDTCAEALPRLASALASSPNNLQVTVQASRVGGRILLDWEHPINFNKLGETVEVVLELRDAAGGPNFLIILPGATPQGPPPGPGRP